MRHRKMLIATTAILLASPAGIGAEEVSAQETEISRLSNADEVVVTASRREERQQDVAMQVSAFSSDTLADAGVTSGKDIVRLTPGMSFTAPSGDSGAIVFNMRGVGLNDFGVGNESPVAIYADDAYQASLSSAAASTFDLDRVEVLRGPQGTLFGRNATGGLVHFVSARPESGFGGYFDARGGAEGLYAEGALNVPFTTALTGRLSLASEQLDPWVENAIGKDGNGVNRTAARFQLLWQRGSNFSGLLNLHGGVSRSRPQYTFLATSSDADGLGVADSTPANVVFGVPNGPAFAALNDNDPYTGAVNTAGYNDRKNYGATLRLEWTVGDIDFTAISDATRNETDFLEDSDVTPVQAYEIPSFSRSIQYSQEIRASQQGERLSWVAGVYYFNNSITNPRRFDLYTAGVSYDSKMEQTAESAAAFGELTFRATPEISLVGGLRYTTEARDVDFQQILLTDAVGDGFGAPTNGQFPVFAFGPGTVGSAAERTDENVSGRLRIEWRPVEDLLLYAAINRGFKSGGFNNPLTADSFTPALMPYAPETLDSFELGIKSDMLDRRLRLNANLFYYDYQDFQSFKTDGLNNYLANIDAEIYGLNLDFTARPLEGLTLTGGLEVLRATAFNVTLPSLRVVDRDLANAPGFSAVMSIQYERAIGEGSGSAELSARYVGEQFYDISNAPVTREPAYAVVDARLGFSLHDAGPELYIAATNVFDEAYRLYTIDVNALGFSQVMYAQPRRVLAGIRLSF